MYLSKIFIADQKPKSIYDIHQDLYTALEHQSQRFLYRIKEQRAGSGAEILLQSEQEPIATRKVQIVESKPISLQFSEQQHLRFLLVANPIKSIQLDKKTGKTLSKPCRVPLLKEEEQQAWLMRKFNNIAILDSLIIRPCAALYFYKKESGGGKIIPVAFEGVLTVKKPDELQKIIENGIGAAKAFGCGLLSVARA